MIRNKYKLINNNLFPRNDKFPVKLFWFRGEASQKRFSLGCHNEVECHYFKEGRGIYLVQGRNYLLRKNSLLIIRPSEIHQYIPFPNTRVENISLLFSLSWLEAGGQQIPFPKDIFSHLALTEKEAVSIEMIFRSIKEEQDNKKDNWMEIIRLELKIFLFSISRIYRQPRPMKVNAPLVAQLMGYIESSFTRQIKISALANDFGYSGAYLSRCFKKNNGLSLKHYLLQRRIIESKRLLEIKPGHKVDAIAEQVGFGDMKAFRRAFKIFVGLSPVDYRKAVAENPTASECRFYPKQKLPS